MKQTLSRTIWHSLFMYAGVVLYIAFHGCQTRHVLTHEDLGALWHEVDSLNKLNLPRSGLEIVNQIQQQSKEQKLTVDYIRSVIYKYQFLSETADNALEEMIYDLESEVDALWVPAQQVAHNILGDFYQQYYLQNQWKLIHKPVTDTGRTHLVEMSALELSRKAIHHYLLSLEKKEVLASELSHRYDGLIEGGNDKMHLRPTLYDLLASRVVEKLLNGSLFELPSSNPYLFSDDFLMHHREQFVTAQIDERHEDEPGVLAIHVLQDWLRFRRNDGDRDALADTDLSRLKWMNDKFSSVNGFQLYENSLRRLASGSTDSEVYASILYEHAQLLANRSEALVAEDDERNYRGEALELIQKSIKAWPESEGAALSRDLEKQILAPYIGLNVESAIAPGQSLVYAVDYKNIDTLYAALFKMGVPDYHNAVQNDERWMMQQISENPSIASEWVLLPEFTDYMEHKAEIRFEAVHEPGYYGLVVSNEMFDHQNISENDLFRTALFQATNLEVVEHIREEGVLISVVDRLSGQPIEGVKVTSLQITGHPEKVVKGETQITGSNGRAILSLNRDDPAINRLLLEKDSDRFFSENRWWNPSSGQQRNRSVRRMSFFTDRNVYRPGQFIHFKGILLENRNDTTRAVSNERIQVFLRDANGQEVSSQSLTTNEYGSVSGKFLLPSARLTGNYSLGSNHGQESFSVEEYRRPRFEVVFQPYSGLAVIGDTVSIMATAKTLTDLPLQNVPVQWTVVRHSHFGWRFPGSGRAEIAAATGQTDINGHAVIEFEARGKTHDAPWFSYHYQIELSVTDLNGETQTGTHTIVLSDIAVRASVETSNWYSDEAMKSLRAAIEIRNFSGEPVASEVFYVIEKLKVKESLLPERIWSTPDTLLYDDPDSIFSTPDREHSVDYMIKNGQVEISGKQDVEIELPQKLTPGQYRIMVRVPDITGDTVLVSSGFSVVNPREAAYQLGEPLTMINMSGDILNTGQEGFILFGTGIESARLKVLAVQADRTILDREYDVDKEWQKISFPVTNDMEGRLVVQAVIYYHNRIYAKNINLQVVKSENLLNLSLSSYRDRVTPGEDQAWTLQLTDGNEQPVEAEIMALMYDASLDQYRPNALQMNVPVVFRPIRVWQWSKSGVVNTGGRLTIPRRQAFPKKHPHFVWDNLVESQRESGIRIRGGGAGYVSKSARDDSMLEIMDSDEDIVPMTRQEEVVPSPPVSEIGPPSIQLRRDLKETAFFFPHLETNQRGMANVDFEMPESLTRWRFMALGHRKDGTYATTEQFVTTVLDLMVVPNLPRIVTEGDELVFMANVLNNNSVELSGLARMELKDAVTGNEIGMVGKHEHPWLADAGNSVPVNWKVKVPEGIRAIEVTVSAISGEISDGERHVIPVRPARVLVTETKPVMLNRSGIHKLEMPVLKEAVNKDFESYTFTYTQNAAWEILDVLPWLMERPVESADQIFNRFFAASMAKEILKQHPQIERVLKAWAAELPGDEDALLSAMERNPELKSTMLAATPWLTRAQNDTERRRYFAAIVKEGKLDQEIGTAISLLKEMQLEGGAWPWFSGMRSSELITFNVLSRFGYLEKQGVGFSNEVIGMIGKASDWLINRLSDRREKAQESDETEVSFIVTGNLYALSFFPDALEHPDVQFWIEMLRNKLPKDPVARLAYSAVILNRTGHQPEANQLLRSIEERIIKGDNQTAYFRHPQGPYWYQAPIMSHVLAMEAFWDLDPEHSAIRGMENWLIQQKRTRSWITTRATVAAVYAMASSPRQLFALDEPDRIEIGGEVLKDTPVISGSGYRSYSIDGKAIQPQMGEIVIHKGSDHPSFASMHLSYFTPSTEVDAGGFLEVNNTWYKRVLAQGEEQWLQVDENTFLQPGDRLMVRVVIETPQALDFVHVDAPRAANLEPIDRLSGFRFGSGLGYYMSVTDAGTSIFIDHLPRGRYSLDWQVTVSHRGTAASAPVSVSCFYAPEFSGRGKGGMINVALDLLRK